MSIFCSNESKQRVPEKKNEKLKMKISCQGSTSSTAPKEKGKREIEEVMWLCFQILMVVKTTSSA